jgi:hypothetical protein
VKNSTETRVYFEEIPEHYVAPQVSLTIHHKPLSEKQKSDLREALKEAIERAMK